MRLHDLSLVLVLVCASHAQSTSPVVRRHTLPPLDTLALPAADGVDLRLPLTSARLDNLEPDSGQGPQVAIERPQAPDFVEYLTTYLEATGSDDVEIEAVADGLRITATPRVHDRIEGFLDTIERELMRTVQFEAFLLPTDTRLEAGSVLDPETATALLAAHTPLDFATCRAPMGFRGRFGTSRWEARLIDFDVEVAENIQGQDPNVTRLLDGLEVAAVAHSLPSGELFLRAWSRQSQPSPEPRSILVNEAMGASVQLASQACTLSSGSAVIERGGALVLGHDRHVGGLLMVRALADPLPPKIALVPIGALLAPPLLVEVPQVYGPAPSGGLSYLHPLREVGELFFERFQADQQQLQEFLSTYSSQLIGFGVHVPAELEGPALAELEPWIAERTRTVSLDMRFGLIDRATAREAVVGGLSTDALAEGLPRRALGSCRVGDSLMVVGGEERHYLQDYDSETANGAHNWDPNVGSLFDGFTLTFLPEILRDGRVSAWTDLTLVKGLGQGSELLEWQMSARNERRDGERSTGEIELPVSTRASLRSTLLLPRDRWTLFTASGLQGTGQALVAVVRVNVRD